MIETKTRLFCFLGVFFPFFLWVRQLAFHVFIFLLLPAFCLSLPQNKPQGSLWDAAGEDALAAGELLLNSLCAAPIYSEERLGKSQTLSRSGRIT